MCRVAKRGLELVSALIVFLLSLSAFADGGSDVSHAETSEGIIGRALPYLSLEEVTTSAANMSFAPVEEPAVDMVAVYQMGFFALHLYYVADLPLEYGYYIWRFSAEQGIEPYDFAAYVVSEKSWSHSDFSIVGKLQRPKKVVFDYEPDAYGSGGELGISQIIPFWVRKARKRCKSENWAEGNCDELVEADEPFLKARKAYKKARKEFGKKSPEAEAAKKVMLDKRTGGMFLPHINFRVAAYVVRKAQEKHAEELTPKMIKQCKKARRKARKARKPPPMCATQLYHEWWAHLKLGPEDRDLKCGRPGYKKRKFPKVRYSMVAWSRPEHIWKANRKEWQKYCEGRE
jgi:hypothetical protein